MAAFQVPTAPDDLHPALLGLLARVWEIRTLRDVETLPY